MTSAIASSLKRLAQSGGSFDHIVFERVTNVGEPAYWEERIYIRNNAQQQYIRTRSVVDEGGAAIGVWQGPAEVQTLQHLALSLSQALAEPLQGSDIEPGEEVTTWRCAIGQERWQLSAASGSPIFDALGNTDLLFRRIANTLVGSKAGAALISEVLIERGDGGSCMLGMALVNTGNQDCYLQNPLLIPGEGAYLQLEIGAALNDPPGVTGLGIQYRPLPMRVAAVLPSPWNDAVLVLKAGQHLICPMHTELQAQALNGNFIRAVYSHYGQATTKSDLPLVRGRVFSTERRIAL